MYLTIVDPTAAGPETGLLGWQLVLLSVLCLPSALAADDSHEEGVLCSLRPASCSSTSRAAVSELALDRQCCITCTCSFGLGIFRHRTRMSLTFKGLASGPCMEAGEGHLGGEGTRQKFSLDGSPLSRAYNESETQWESILIDRCRSLNS